MILKTFKYNLDNQKEKKYIYTPMYL